MEEAKDVLVVRCRCGADVGQVVLEEAIGLRECFQVLRQSRIYLLRHRESGACRWEAGRVR